jgi:nitrite reductase/ring-hydroxylating ferredoxin subunit
MAGGWQSVGAETERADLDLVVIQGREVALARLDDGAWAAFDNSCPHEDCPLSDGTLDGDQIICYCHSGTFDLRTGEVIEGPAEEPLTIFGVRVIDGELQVEVSW